MSQTFSLVCHQTRQKIQIGQGWKSMSVFYSGEPETMSRLGRFLEATRGKPIVLICEDSEGKEALDYEDFEETQGTP